MKAYLVACLIMLGIQAVAEAEGLEPLHGDVVASAELPSSDKSFFDAHTKEDIQRMLDFESEFKAEMKAENPAQADEAG